MRSSLLSQVVVSRDRPMPDTALGHPRYTYVSASTVHYILARTCSYVPEWSGEPAWRRRGRLAGGGLLLRELSATRSGRRRPGASIVVGAFGSTPDGPGPAVASRLPLAVPSVRTSALRRPSGFAVRRRLSRGSPGGSAAVAGEVHLPTQMRRRDAASESPAAAALGLRTGRTWRNGGHCRS